MHSLAVKGGDELVRIWKTEKLVPDNLIGAMVDVRIPSDNETLMSGMRNEILNRYNINVLIYSLENPKGYWARASAQIFNEIVDFQNYGNIVKDLIDESK